MTLFAETDLAIYKRLTGYPLDSKGRPLLDATGVPVNREVIGPPEMNGYDKIWDAPNQKFIEAPPQLPSYGVRVPLAKQGQTGARGLTNQDPDALRPFALGFEPNSFRQVPVFDQNLSSRKYDDIWPCVTFRWNEVEFEPGTYVFHDPIGYNDPTSAPVAIKNRLGQTIESGYAQNVRRRHPESWNPYYTISAWAKTLIELQFITQQIMYLFPGKGALTIEFQDGRKHTCDMLLQRTLVLDESRDEVPGTQGPEEQRGYGRAFVYLVEGYLDNTTNQFGVQDVRSNPAVIQRLFEIDNIMTGIAQPPSTDLNLQELAPIPPNPQGGL
jgi:hypothetical protein